MKKIIYIPLTLILFSVLGFYFYDEQKVLERYHSPDGDYVLVIVSERGLFSMTMPGDGGESTPVEAILKDANGKIIGRSGDNSKCGVLKFSIDVEWDLKNGEVWYGRAKTINLKTGKVEC